MQKFKYLSGVSTLYLNEEACAGCGMCEMVCPHGVLRMEKRKARIADADRCMECGACALNCPVAALKVTPGVGCAHYIIQTWIKGKKRASCAAGCC